MDIYVQEGEGVLRRSRKWIWAGRVVAVATTTGIGIYLLTNNAEKLVGVAGVVLALLTLIAPYLLPPPQPARISDGSTARPHKGPTGAGTQLAGSSLAAGAVDVSQSRGVQINQASGNTQSNTFNDTP